MSREFGRLFVRLKLKGLAIDSEEKEQNMVTYLYLMSIPPTSLMRDSENILRTCEARRTFFLFIRTFS